VKRRYIGEEDRQWLELGWGMEESAKSLEEKRRRCGIDRWWGVF
jgi:hypothetical protein